MLEENTITVPVAGKELIFRTGKIARQANGAVMLSCGETYIFSSACAAKTASPDIDFFPLRVDYQEKFSSAGKTLGGFIKREGRPTERETLTARLIDRPLRPMFEKGFFNETQLLSYVMSYDGMHAPEPLAICAASAALTISDIPLIKPVGAVQVGMIGNEFIINPTVQERELSKLDLILAGTEDAILMIEGYCDFLTEEQVLAAIDEGHEAIKAICKALNDWREQIGKPKNLETLRSFSEELLQEVENLILEDLKPALSIIGKKEREQALGAIDEKVFSHFMPEGEPHPLYSAVDIKQAVKKVSAKHMREMILNNNIRPDGRNSQTVRPIHIDLGYLPRTHGSAIFTRGETQAVAVCTLGGGSMAQRFEDLNQEGTQKFYLQYFFPPFSVGEVGRAGPPGRREIGHGKLAEKALRYTIPEPEHFPYTIRLESNITESNGSSSMASVCGGCLALMEAGVPVKRPVAGIAMGLILENDRFAILSDILGIEDALGDMDFKITGDEKGITAFQMDIKVEGINRHIMESALSQAKEGRIHILHEMLKACPSPKASLSAYAPKIETLQVKPSKIAIVIGPGGKQIRSIIEETGVEIDIDDDGNISLTSTEQESIDKAKAIIINLTSDVEIGKTYLGEVTGIRDFGLFVRIFSKEGLCHISELSHSRIENIYDHYNIGDKLEVKVLDINDRGQIKLSHKALLKKEAKV
ncbi:MAG: polyribonucleotide nucleotidyltransferase [Simkaniaceae bacterium]